MGRNVWWQLVPNRILQLGIVHHKLGYFWKVHMLQVTSVPNHKFLWKESTFCMFGKQKHISMDNVQVCLIMFMSHVHQTLGYQKNDQVETVRSNDKELEKMNNSSYCACGSFGTLTERPRIQSLSTPIIPAWPWWRKPQINGLQFQTAKFPEFMYVERVTYMNWGIVMISGDDSTRSKAVHCKRLSSKSNCIINISIGVSAGGFRVQGLGRLANKVM